MIGLIVIIILLLAYHIIKDIFFIKEIRRLENIIIDGITPEKKQEIEKAEEEQKEEAENLVPFDEVDSDRLLKAIQEKGEIEE